MAENAEQIGIVPPLKWEYVHNVINQNNPIEHAQTVATIKVALLFQLKQVNPFP